MNSARDTSFKSIALSAKLHQNLDDLGYLTMTEIQSAALPEILKGRDIIGRAKTGSGKTAAFGLGLLQKLRVDQFRVQALVMCPTRELADQVANELRKLARTIHNIKILTLCGGMPYGPQKGSLEHGAHIIVGTPGRIEEHLRKGNLSLENVDTLVLDEADRMLDMGFQEALDAIVGQVPAQRQTLLFSATYPDSISVLAQRVQIDPLLIEIESKHNQASIAQHFYLLGNADRNQALSLLLAKFTPQSCVIFCNTKRETEEVADFLKARGFTALALHGDMEQKIRDQSLVCFANKSVPILVATDVAARGLDIEELDMVVNYQLSRDPEVHIHRIGRTGRAGQKGIAISLLTEKERFKLEPLESLIGETLNTEALPPSTDFTVPKPAMVTLLIDGGKKQKLRPGDIVGALTGVGGIDAEDIGKIHMFPMRAFVAIKRQHSRQALKILSQGKMKGKNFRARVIGV